MPRRNSRKTRKQVGGAALSPSPSSFNQPDFTRQDVEDFCNEIKLDMPPPTLNFLNTYHQHVLNE